MKVINLISGPRNLSTALMYSFAQREDTVVLDEPFYGYYLKNAKVDVSHPSEKDILKSMNTNETQVVRYIETLSEKKHVFVKGMAHHCLSSRPDFILKWSNIILIRHPEKLLTSFSKVIENPTLKDIGIKKATEIFSYLNTQGKAPLVIDSDELLLNPSAYLKKVCDKLEIPFTSAMLSWEKGGIPEDGVWAKHWYHNVHNSTGFAVQNSIEEAMPKKLQPILNEALSYYNILKNNILKND